MSHDSVPDAVCHDAVHHGVIADQSAAMKNVELRRSFVRAHVDPAAGSGA